MAPSETDLYIWGTTMSEELKMKNEKMKWNSPLTTERDPLPTKADGHYIGMDQYLVTSLDVCLCPKYFVVDDGSFVFLR